ncbi:ABC transporter substrate-binding protein [Neorhizobium sp. P12A]|uniref:ABC transporter substrate-binding protein n=1 Tax=Neorhizobium sp. P12A TaxID=2268027 RepID=UPI0011ED9BF7|nr:ABC transporter substrate-binding protein [Neorhizobium sp. P12A]KAA0698661.1 ABC transporter substrate-binding protein [Neorhizobium sp. P12A]
MPLITRRQALAFTLAAALPISRSALAASALTKVSVALDWTPNTNHIGLYIAQAKGFYSDAGLDVAILPYTDTDAGTLVANGVADFGVSGAIGLFTQCAAGAEIKGVYAIVQTETGRVVFNDERKDIQRPRDLDGKTYGGFGSAWETALISAMIRNDGGKGEVNTVTLGTSAYEALANGSVDFTLEVYTWEGIEAQLEKKALRRFRYTDYGVPDEQTTAIVAGNAFLDSNPEAARGFIQATKRGYDYAVDHADEAADLLVSTTGGALTNADLVKASLKALIDGHYLRTADGKSGIFDPAEASAIGDFLFTNGILLDAQGAKLKDKPDVSRYYTNQFFS